jgi:hypothetical protein|tara:strand:+ start:1824 stop:3098 length:1275 start_codon:yes stop_codon:yes gene_type:complete
MSKPIFIISCPFDTYSGYGARSRDIVKAIVQSDKYNVKLLPQRWGSTSWGFCESHPEWEFLNDLKVLKVESKPDIWMQITIPNEFQAVGKYNIGCTAGIEADLCKPEWVEGLNRMDRNFVSSKFTKAMFESQSFDKKSRQTNQVIGNVKLEKPIDVVFEGVNLDIYKPLKNSELNTFDFTGIKESFCYLFVGHWMKADFGHDRKNVSLLVKAFYETFKNKKKQPALILKSSTGVAGYMSRDEILDKIKHIKKSVDGKNLPNVYVLNGEFTDSEMNELYNNPKVKAMVSLTKGEGFGRPLLEFTTSGKPVLASGWSGHTDFLHKEFSTLIPGELELVHPSAANNWLVPEAKWFKPDTRYIGGMFKDIFEKYKDFLNNSKRQRYYTEQNYSWNHMEKLVNQILDDNIPEFPKKMELKLPELNIPKL